MKYIDFLTQNDIIKEKLREDIMIILPIALLIIAYFAVGLYIFKSAFSPQKDPDWSSKEALEKTAWKRFSDTVPAAVQWLVDHGAVDVSIKSFDGLTLSGKWMAHPEPRGTVLVVHGYHSSYVTDFGQIFPLYERLGLNVLMIRQRAHDGSEGKYITFGTLEHRDLLKWIDFHNERFGSLPMFVSGMSMGASTVMYALGEELPDNVFGASADSGFTSPREIISKVIKDRIGFSLDLVLPAVNFWCKTLGKFNMNECDSRRSLARAKVPLLMIHGEADDFVPCEMTRQGFEACASEKVLITVKDADHGTSYLYEPERIISALDEIFQKHLK